jgi:hypothetical protein
VTALAERNGGRRFVIAFFETRVAGLGAARKLSREQESAGKRGVVGMLALDDLGRPDLSELGDPATGEGPGIGAVLGAIASALVGGVLPPKDHFFDARSDLTTDDIARIGAELEAGHVAVAVLDRRSPAERIVYPLTELGGKTEIHRLSAQALRQAAEALGPAS